MSLIIDEASSQLGVKELSGPNANPTILQYAKDCGFNNYHSDEMAWCSLFANWVALKTGLERSNNLSARSWLNVGLPITTPEPGDVVIFWRDQRESWQGHVAFFTGFSTDSTRIYCLGGNQGNQVSITAYPALRLLGFRRLRPIAVTHFSQKDLKLGDTGAAVVKLQDSLKQLGLKVGTSDGVFGSMTESALKDFQSTNTELKINGIFDNDTRAFLSAKIPLQ